MRLISVSFNPALRSRPVHSKRVNPSGHRATLALSRTACVCSRSAELVLIPCVLQLISFRAVFRVRRIPRGALAHGRQRKRRRSHTLLCPQLAKARLAVINWLARMRPHHLCADQIRSFAASVADRSILRVGPQASPPCAGSVAEICGCPALCRGETRPIAVSPVRSADGCPCIPPRLATPKRKRSRALVQSELAPRAMVDGHLLVLLLLLCTRCLEKGSIGRTHDGTLREQVWMRR
jgi:hypothetical protein